MLLAALIYNYSGNGLCSATIRMFYQQVINTIQPSNTLILILNNAVYGIVSNCLNNSPLSKEVTDHALQLSCDRSAALSLSTNSSSHPDLVLYLTNACINDTDNTSLNYQSRCLNKFLHIQMRYCLQMKSYTRLPLNFLESKRRLPR